MITPSVFVGALHESAEFSTRYGIQVGQEVVLLNVSCSARPELSDIG